MELHNQRYISDIYKKYGSFSINPSIPKLSLSKQLKWMLMHNIKGIRPLWYVDYDKEQRL